MTNPTMGKTGLVGSAFGHLTVVRLLPERTDGGNRHWECLCTCGSSVVATTGGLNRGRPQSCGCLRAAAVRLANTRHGGSRRSVPAAPEYKAWSGIKRRCLAVTGRDYRNYGGRGIRVCEAWSSSYAAFLAHVGPRPSAKHSIDRIDNDGHYEPGNVRWATRSAQGQNTRRTRLTEDDVHAIRCLRALGISGGWIGRMFRMSSDHVRSIGRGERWA